MPEPIIRLMRSLPPVNGMDALRTIASALAHYDAEVDDASPQAQYRKAVRLTAQTGTIVATWGRLQQGGGPIAPDPAMGHAATFLYMLTGERPNSTAIRAFDVALILHADHELNASTFAGRVAAATLTDIYSAVVAAIGTLKGPLHGGANAEVMKMLLELGQTASADRVDEFIRGKLARRKRSRASGIASTRPKIRARRTCVRCHAISASAPATPRGSTCRSASSAREGREEAQSERRLLFGVDLLHARHSDRSLHADLRGQPYVGMDRTHPRAVREQPLDSPARRLHRSVVPAAIRPTRTAIAAPDQEPSTKDQGPNHRSVASIDRRCYRRRPHRNSRHTLRTSPW
jgi:citrate synthase